MLTGGVPAPRRGLRRAVTGLLVAGLVSAGMPAQVSRAADDSGQPAPSAPAGQDRAGAQVIGAVVPYLPMETSGHAFARLFALNLGSSPTVPGSTTSINIGGLPAGVVVDNASPAPSADGPGWKCEVSACSWVTADGQGAQIPVGDTIEGIIRFRIPEGSQIPALSTAEVQDMVDASTKPSKADDPTQRRLQEIARRLTRLKISVSFRGDEGATAQETESYLGTTDTPGEARVGAVMSGRSTAATGESAKWDLTVINIGGKQSPATVTVNNVLPAGIGLEDVKAEGKGWTCRESGSGLSGCTHSGVLEPGGMSEPLRITSTVSEGAVTNKENKWQLEVEGMPAFVPADGTFTATPAVAPDLGVQMIVGNQVVVPGRSVDLALQIATYAGATTKPVTLSITGLPGARFASSKPSEESLAAAADQAPTDQPAQVDYLSETGAAGSMASTDADGDIVSEPTLSGCSSTPQGVTCNVRPIRQGELVSADLSLLLPEDLTADDNSLVIRAEVTTENEESGKLANNVAATPVVLQPANRPYPALMPARADDKGVWEVFGGESIRLKSGTSTSFAYVIKNSGAKPFPAGTRLAFRLFTQDAVTIRPRGAWNCSEKSLPAPSFTEEQRLGAATAARSAGIGFDPETPASKLEEDLLRQIKEQAVIVPIPDLSGEVPGFECEVTTSEEIPVDGLSAPAQFDASATDDAEVAVKLWRAELTEPALEKAPRVDVSALTAVVKKSVTPVVVSEPVRSGALGTVRVSLSNSGELAADHPSVILSVPAGLRFRGTSALPDGWKCIALAQGITGGLVVCSGASLGPDVRSGVAEFRVQADPSRAAPSSITAVAVGDSRRIGLANVAESIVGVKERLTVQMMGPESVNDVSIPVGGGEPGPTRVHMTAQSTTDGLRYTWRQLCTAQGEDKCIGTAPKVTWVKDEGQNAEFVTPQVSEPVDLLIEVTARDADATTKSIRIVKLLPRPKVKAPPAAAGASIAWRHVTRSAAPAEVSPAPGATLCAEFSSEQPFRYGGKGCSSVAVGGNVALLFMGVADAVSERLEGNGGAALSVVSSASWAAASATTGASPRVRVSLSQSGLGAVSRSATVTVQLRTAAGVPEPVGSFTVVQSSLAPAPTIGGTRPLPSVQSGGFTTTTLPSSAITSSTQQVPAAATTTVPSASTTTTSSVRPPVTTTAAGREGPTTTAPRVLTTVGATQGSDLLPLPSNGSRSNAPRLSVIRQLGAIAVRANVLGGPTVRAARGGDLRLLAGASGSNSFDWSWRVVSGPADLVTDPGFLAAVDSVGGPGLRVSLPAAGPGRDITPEAGSVDPVDSTVPAAVTDTTAPVDTTAVPQESTTTAPPVQTPVSSDGSGTLVLMVTASAGGRSAVDIVTVLLHGEDEVAPAPGISLDAVSSSRPLVLAPSSSATVGAAVSDGLRIRWTAQGDGVTVSGENDEGVTVSTSSATGTGWVVAEALDGTGTVVDTALFAVVSAHPSAFPDFCGSLSTGVSEALGTLGGLDISDELAGATDCALDQSVSFEGKELTLPVARITALSGTVSREGVFISAGTVAPQVDLPVKDLRVENLFVPFRVDGSAGPLTGWVTGTLADSVTRALQLENWVVSADVRVTEGSFSSVSVTGRESAARASRPGDATTTTEGTGTVPDTAAVAPGGATEGDLRGTGEIVATGAFGGDGSTSLSVSVSNLMLFGLVRVSGSGSVEFGQGEEGSVEVSAELAEPVTITDGVQLSRASLTVTNDSVTGTGGVDIERGGLRLGVTAAVELSKEAQRLSFESTIDTLEPVNGFEMSGVEVSGELSHTVDGWSGALEAAADDLSFAGGYVKVTEPSVSLAVDCTSGGEDTASTSTVDAQAGIDGNNLPDGAGTNEEETPRSLPTTTDRSGCAVSFGLAAGLEVGTDNPATGTLVAAVDTAAGTVEFEGNVASISLGNGASVDSASIKVMYEDGEFSFSGEGEMTILDTKVTASLEASASDFVVRAGVENLQPFGDTGLRLEAGEVVLVAATGDDEGYLWSPGGEDLSGLVGDQRLSAGDVRIAAVVGMPGSFDNVRSLTKDRFSLPTRVTVTGAYSFSDGRASLDVGTADGSLSVSGSLARDDADGEWSYDFNVRIPGSLRIVQGFELEELSLTVSNRDDEGGTGPLTVSGRGQVEVSLSSVSATATAEVTFRSPTSWSVAVSGAVPAFSAVPGLELNDLEFDGSLEKSGPSFSGSLKMGAADISLAGGVVRLVDPSLELTVRCGAEASPPTTTGSPSAGQPDAPGGSTGTAGTAPATTVTGGPSAQSADTEVIAGDGPGQVAEDGTCRLAVDASVGVVVTANGRAYTGELAGSIDTEAGTASLTAELGDVDLGQDVTLTGVRFAFEVSGGEAGATLDGGLRIFGTTVNGRVTVSSDTAVLQASVSNLSPFGAGGPSITAGEIAFVLRAPAAGWAWDPLDPALETLVEGQTVSGLGIRLAAVVGMPEAFARVESITRGAVALPTVINLTGAFDFGSGAVSLVASAPSSNYDISGTLSRQDGDADWSWAVEFRTLDDINLIPGFNRLTLTEVSFRITNTDEEGNVGGVTVSAEGGLRITVSDSAVLNLGAEVRFAGSDDWELSVTSSIAGADGGSWQVIPGLSLPATDVSGTVSKSDGVFSAQLRIEQKSDWRPISAVTIKDLFIEIGVRNQPSTGWQFRFLLGGKLTVRIGSISIPEMAITGGYEEGVWFLQVQVGNEMCRDIPVNESAGAASTTSAPSSSSAPAGPSSSSAAVTTAVATTTTLPMPPPPAAGQSLYRLSPSNSPPRADNSKSNVPTATTVVPPAAAAATSTTGSPSVTSAPGTTVVDGSGTSEAQPRAATQQVCERVLRIADGLEIVDGTFRLEYDTNESELSVAINGGIRILGFRVDASAKLSNRGVLLIAGVKNWELFDGGPTFSELAIVASTYATTYTLASGYEASVPANDVTLIAQMAVPEGITKTVGDVQLEPLQISMRGLLSGNIDLRIGIILPPEAWIFRAGGYGLRLSSVGLQLSIRNFADLTVGVYGEARLLVPDQDNQVPFRIAISFSSTGTLSISASMGLDAQGNVLPWRDVFGIDGLVINFAAFSFGINFSSTPIPTPEIGLAISFELPTAIKQLVGMEEGITIEGAFFFSTTRGVCLVVQVGQEPEVGDTARTLPRAIDMFESNLIGNYLGIKFAPIGCTIAEKRYEPGISLGFSAAIMGVSFTALAKLDIPKLELQVYANFDEFSIGGLRMKQTYLDLLVSGTNPLDSHVIFSGGFDLDLPAGRSTVALRVVANLGDDPTFAIDGRVDRLVVVPGIVEINRVRIQGLVKPLDLRLFINLDGDVRLLGAAVTGRFRLDIDDSGVREVSANLAANFAVGSNAIAMNGMFDLSYLRGGFPNLRFNGSLVIANQELASAEGQLDQYSFSLKAKLNLGSVFNGQVEGKIIFCNPDGSIKITNRAGQQVTGAKGDYYFAATASIDLGFAAANGNIRLGRTPEEDRVISENCPVMAPTITSADADAVMDAAMDAALRCAPGLNQPTTTNASVTTLASQSTSTTEPCPDATSTTVSGGTAGSTVPPGATSIPGGATTVPGVSTSVTPGGATTVPGAAGQSLFTGRRPAIDNGSTDHTCARSTGSATNCDILGFGSLSTNRVPVTAPILLRGYDRYIRAGAGVVQAISMENPPLSTETTLPVASSAGNVTLSRTAECRAQVSTSSPSISGSAFRFQDSSTSRAACLSWSSAPALVSRRSSIGFVNTFSSTSWTLEAWVRPDSTSVTQPIFGGAGNAVNLYVNSSGRLVVSAGTVASAASTVSLTAGQWNHVVVTQTAGGTTSAGTYQFYVNGVAAGSSAALFTTAGTLNPTGTVGYSPAGGTAFTGSIDEPTWYNRALPASEVKSHFDVATGLNNGSITENETFTVSGRPAWATVTTGTGASACGTSSDVSCVVIQPTTEGVIGSDQSATVTVTRRSVRLVNDAARNAAGTFTETVSTDMSVRVTQSGQAALPPNTLSCTGSAALNRLTGFAIGQTACAAVTGPVGAFSADLELDATAATRVNSALSLGRVVDVSLTGLEGTTSYRRQGSRVFAQVNVTALSSATAHARGILSVSANGETIARLAIGRSRGVDAVALANGRAATSAGTVPNGAPVWCPQQDGTALGTAGSAVGCRTIVFRSSAGGVTLDILNGALMTAANRAESAGSIELAGRPAWLTTVFGGVSHAGLPAQVTITPTSTLAPGSPARRATVRLLMRNGTTVTDLGALTVVQVADSDPTGEAAACRRSSSGTPVAEGSLASACSPYLPGAGGQFDLGRLSPAKQAALAEALADGMSTVSVSKPDWVTVTPYETGNFGIDRSLNITIAPNTTGAPRTGAVRISTVDAAGNGTLVSTIELAQGRNVAPTVTPVCVRRLGAGGATRTNGASPCGAAVLPGTTGGSLYVTLSAAVRNQLVNAAVAGARVVVSTSGSWALPEPLDGAMAGVPEGYYVNVTDLPEGINDRRATLSVVLRGADGAQTGVSSFLVVQQRVRGTAAQTTDYTCRGAECAALMLDPNEGLSIVRLTPAIEAAATAALANGGSLEVRAGSSWFSAVEQYDPEGRVASLAVSVRAFVKGADDPVERTGSLSVVHRAADAAGTASVLGSVQLAQTYPVPPAYGTNLTTCIQAVVASTQGNLDARCVQRIFPASGAEEVVTLRTGVSALRVRASQSWVTASVPNGPDAQPQRASVSVVVRAAPLPAGAASRTAEVAVENLVNGAWTRTGAMTVIQQGAKPAVTSQPNCESPAPSAAATVTEGCDDLQLSQFSGSGTVLSLDPQLRSKLRAQLASGQPLVLRSSQEWASLEAYDWVDDSGVAVPSSLAIRFAPLAAGPAAIRRTELTVGDTTGGLTVENLPRSARGTAYMPMACATSAGPNSTGDGDFLMGQTSDTGGEAACASVIVPQPGGTKIMNMRVPLGTAPGSTADLVSGTQNSARAAFTCTPTQAVQGDYTVLTFTNTSPCTWAPPAGVLRMDTLVIGGGGGGGFDAGGGAGGGQVTRADGVAVSPAVAMTFTVGVAGTAGTQTSAGTNGGISSITGGTQAVTALGGRGGDRCDWNGSSCQGRNRGGTGQPSALEGSGSGGDGFCATSTGAACTGASPARAGGAGFVSSITGTSVRYGTGGAGGNFEGSVPPVSVGGGGRGGASQAPGSNGSAGAVIVRYRTTSVGAPRFYYVTSSATWLRGQLVFGPLAVATGNTGNASVSLALTVDRLSNVSRPRTGSIFVRESLTNSVVRRIDIRQDRTVTPTSGTSTGSADGAFNTFPSTFATDSNNIVFDSSESSVLTELKSVGAGLPQIGPSDSLRIVKSGNAEGNWVSSMLWDGISGPGNTVNKAYVHVDELPNGTGERTARLEVQRLRTLPASLAGTCAPATSQSGRFTVVTFSGTTPCTWAPPAGVTQVDMLLVGGGAGGGFDSGAGGSAGQVMRYNSVVMPTNSLATVTVGAGGTAGASSQRRGADGSGTSVVFGDATYRAGVGAGGGGCNWNGANCQNANASVPGTSGNIPGNGAGGAGFCATSTGTACSGANAAAAGGAGTSDDLVGSAVVYAAGGAGGNLANAVTSTAPGSGGRGGNSGAAGDAGRNGTVIVRYRTSETSVWQPVATMTVTQRRSESTRGYVLPASKGRTVECTARGGYWYVNPVADQCTSVTIGYRVPTLDIWMAAPNSFWTQTIRSDRTEPAYKGYMANTGFLTNARDLWAPQISPGVWTSNQVYRALFDVSPNRLTGRLDINTVDPATLWDGQTRQFTMRYVGTPQGTLAPRFYDAEVGTLTVRQLGRDLPEYVSSPMPALKGDPGPAGIDCVVGNSPMLYDDGSGDRTRGCRVLEVGSDVTTVGLGMNQSAIDRAIVDTDDGTNPQTRCIWKIETAAEVNNPRVRIVTNDLRANGRHNVACGARGGVESGAQTVTLPDVAPNEVLVVQVVVKYRSMQAYLDDPANPRPVLDTTGAWTQSTWENADKFEEYLGDYFIVKYGANSVAAEETAYARMLAESGGASPYELPLPVAPSQANAARDAANAAAAAADATFAAYQAALGLAPRVTWGDIAITASVNLGPLQGSFNLAGSFDTSGRIDLDVNGTLTVAPLANAAVTGSFKRRPDGQYTVNMSFDANVAGIAQVRFDGVIRNGTYDFKGTGAFSLGSVVQADGRFRLTNTAGAEGLVAQVNFFAGQQGLASVRGRGQAVFSSTWWDAEFAGRLFTPIATATADVKLGNLRYRTGSCTGENYTGGTVRIAGEEFCTLNSVQLNANASLTVFRQNFALNLVINGNRFSATALAPANYVTNAATTGQTDRMNTFGRWTVFWLPFKSVTVSVWWGGALTLQSTDPAISFAGSARVSVDWYFSVTCYADIAGQFRPTRLGASLGCDGIPRRIGFNIG